MHNRLVANVLRLRPKTEKAQPVLVGPTWTHSLTAPIRAGDNQNIARAHSYLLNWVKDSSGLTPAEAQDIVNWMDHKGIK